MLNEKESDIERLLSATAQAIDGKMKYALCCCCMLYGKYCFWAALVCSSAASIQGTFKFKNQLDMHVLEKLMFV